MQVCYEENVLLRSGQLNKWDVSTLTSINTLLSGTRRLWEEGMVFVKVSYGVDHHNI